MKLTNKKLAELRAVAAHVSVERGYMNRGSSNSFLASRAAFRDAFDSSLCLNLLDDLSTATTGHNTVQTANSSLLATAHRLEKELAEAKTEIERLRDVLLRLGRGCEVRKVSEEWPALTGIINQAIEMGRS